MGVSIQPQANVVTVYREQATPGVIATNDSSAKVFRGTSTSGLKLAKGSIASNEVRSDLQKQRDRHGQRSVTGELPGELSLGTYDDLLQAVMRSTWTATLSSASFTLTSYVQATGILTRAAGSFLADGFKVGDVVTANAAIGANQAIPVVLTAVGTTTATIGNRLAWADASGPTGVILTRPKKLTLGTTRRYFTVEHWASVIANSERFVDVRVSSVTFTFQAGKSVGISFGFTGRDLQPAATQYFTSATTTTSLQMAAPDAVAIVQSAQSTTLRSCSITLNLNHTAPEVAGSLTTPDIVEGQATVTGDLSLIVTSQSQLTAYLNETQVMLGLMFRELGTFGFLSVALTNLTFGDYDTERVGNGDAQLITVPFMVGIASGADRDASMLTICTSAA